MERPADSLTARPAARKGGWLALAAVMLVVCSLSSYMLLLDVPWIRSTGAPVWIGFAIATMLALLAIGRDKRIWVRGIAILVLAFILFDVYMFFGLMRLPTAHSIAVGAAVPPLALPDHTGKPIALLDAARSGPRLLVFYRGFW